MDLPPHLVTERLVIRPWTVDDAGPLNDAVARSREHLVPFMPWASLPPMTLEDRAGWIADTSTPSDVGIVLGMLDHHGTIVGGTGYHLRIGPGGIEIGYWVHVDHVGRGLATEATLALTRHAFLDDSIDRVEIHHDKANVPSRRVPEKLGYAFADEYPRTIEAPAESGITVVWRMTRELWEDVSGH